MSLDKKYSVLQVTQSHWTIVKIDRDSKVEENIMTHLWDFNTLTAHFNYERQWSVKERDHWAQVLKFKFCLYWLANSTIQLISMSFQVYMPYKKTIIIIVPTSHMSSKLI